MKKIAPLPGSFMLVSIFGFLFALFFLKDYTLNGAVIVGLISIIMFFASVISMTRAPIEDELALEETFKGRKSRVKIVTGRELAARKKKAANKNTKKVVKKAAKKKTKKVVKKAAKKKTKKVVKKAAKKKTKKTAKKK